MQRNRGITRTEEQIGQLLVEGGFITQELLDEAITTVQQEAITLRNALVSKGISPTRPIAPSSVSRHVSPWWTCVKFRFPPRPCDSYPKT